MKRLIEQVRGKELSIEQKRQRRHDEADVEASQSLARLTSTHIDRRWSLLREPYQLLRWLCDEAVGAIPRDVFLYILEFLYVVCTHRLFAFSVWHGNSSTDHKGVLLYRAAVPLLVDCSVPTLDEFRGAFVQALCDATGTPYGNTVLHRVYIEKGDEDINGQPPTLPEPGARNFALADERDYDKRTLGAQSFGARPLLRAHLILYASEWYARSGPRLMGSYFPPVIGLALSTAMPGDVVFAYAPR
jgi:hypothetical protein